MVSQAELILRVITLWFLVLSQFFRDGMGPFKVLVLGNNLDKVLSKVATVIIYNMECDEWFLHLQF